MWAIISAIITLVTILIISVFNCICGMCDLGGYEGTHGVVGAAEKNEFKKSIDISITDMNTLIDIQSQRMNPELKAAYKKLFIQEYLLKDTPPVVTMDDIKYQLPYQGATRVFKTSTHIGQRKLFDTELQFFTNHLHADKKITCIYAGAAPSNHTGYLSWLFPNVKFILVDPNPFEVYEANPVILQPRKNGPDMTAARAKELVKMAVEGNERIYIINDLMTMDIAHAAKELIDREDLYFVSDIRTNVTDGVENPDVTDILWNLSQQYNWMSVMKPRWSMLKYRHPFYEEDPSVFEAKCKQQPYATDFELSKEFGIDFVENYKTKHLTYWDGKVYIQAFPGPSSTETRLVTDATSTRDWGTHEEYENKLFYYNTIDRCFCHHFNDNADADLGFDNCNDCALENLLWKNYITAYPAIAAHMNNNVRLFVAKLSRNTHRPLIRDNHGRFFDGKYPLRRLIQTAEDYQSDPEKKVLMFPPPNMNKNRQQRFDNQRFGNRKPNNNRDGNSQNRRVG